MPFRIAIASSNNNPQKGGEPTSVKLRDIISQLLDIVKVFAFIQSTILKVFHIVLYKMHLPQYL